MMPIHDFSVTAAHYVGAHVIKGYHYVLFHTASVGFIVRGKQHHHEAVSIITSTEKDAVKGLFLSL